MNIVIGKEVADELRQKYTVLELDSIEHPDAGVVTAYCVVPVEQIVLEMSTLDTNTALHGQLIEAMNNDNTTLARELCVILKGKFGGELDTFYDEVIARIDTTHSTKLTKS